MCDLVEISTTCDTLPRMYHPACCMYVPNKHYGRNWYVIYMVNPQKELGDTAPHDAEIFTQNSKLKCQSRNTKANSDIHL
jgi:hypothetical protein